MISNKKQSARALLTFSGVWAVLIILFTLSFLDLFTSPLWLRLSLGVIIGLVALFFYLGGYHYIQIEIKDNKEITVKYYNLFPLGRKFQVFKIPIQHLHHHEIQFGSGGLTCWLILFQKMQGGIAKYPAVGLSALDKNKRQEIEQFLDKLEKTHK